MTVKVVPRRIRGTGIMKAFKKQHWNKMSGLDTKLANVL
jgi:hypothetical protein